MTQKSLRFGIGNSESLHSATWKLWTETSGGNSEVYLACRSLGGELKASMHQSRNWHIAFSESTYQEKVAGVIPSLNSRFTDRWPQPPDIANGVTLAFRIVTPSTAVTSNTKVKNPNKLVWIPTPSETRAIEIYVLITTTQARIPEWPGKESMGTDLIGSFQLNNGNTVWAVSYELDAPDFSKLRKGTGHLFKGKKKSDLKNSDNLRALVFGDEPDGSRVIYDVDVRLGTG